MTTLLIAGGTVSSRAGLEARLARRPSLHVAAGMSEMPLARQVEEVLPDVLLLDLDADAVGAALDELGGLGAPRVPAIVVLTNEPRAAARADALRAGVRAVLPRGATSAEIIAAIEAVAAGLVVLHPDGLEARPPGPAVGARPSASEADQPLTVRETEVLAMLAEGLGNKLIAARLGISEHTVKFHVASIFAKLGAGTRTEAVTIGIRRGLIMI